MVNRARARAEPSDPYYNLLVEHWDKIVKLYRMFQDKRPIIVYDVQEHIAYAYPYQDYKAELSERSQMKLEKQYKEAIDENKIVVFVRDNDKRKLVSYWVA